MRDCDFVPFSREIDDAFGLYGKAPTAGQKAMFFGALKAYPLEAVKLGLQAHFRDPQRGRFAPLPADVIAQIEGLVECDGRPGPEEAWAMVLRGQDEAETIVWTQEMAQAWAIAKPVLQAGDEVGARMAFREAYGRLTDEARRLRMPAAWSASLGHDPQRRDVAIAAAVQAGRLPASELPALPAPAGVPLLALEGVPGIPDDAREALLRLRASLTSQSTAPSLDALQRKRTQRLKEAMAEKVRRATS